MNAHELGRYYRTVRHLRPRQVLTRIARRAWSPPADLRPRPPLRERVGTFVAPVRREVWPEPGVVRLLNIEKRFGPTVDWTPADESRLFRYELNYFSGLPSSPSSDLHASLVLDWIENSPPGTPDAWDPYPTSRRIINWVKWLVLGGGLALPADADTGSLEARAAGPADGPDAGGGRTTASDPVGPADGPDAGGGRTTASDPVGLANGPDAGGGATSVSGSAEGVLDSLAVQARWLERRIEHDIGANHLFANAMALAHAGAFFAGGEGDRWLDRGSSLIEAEIEEQVLDDGGHYERSPMYHAVFLEDLLDFINVMTAYETNLDECALSLARAGRAAERMLTWLLSMSHPDGEISFFSDSTGGEAARPEELAAYAARLGLEIDRRPEAAGLGVEPGRKPGAPLEVLSGAGFFRLTSGDGRTVAIMDAAGAPPDYQPGHMHCDALSMEVSRDGERLVVNSGISTYEAGPARARERATAAHSTLRIDGAEQAEMWSSHRVGRRPGPGLAGVESEREPVSVFAVHGGFAHLVGGLAHRRTVTLDDSRLVVSDEVHTDSPRPGTHTAEIFFHLHPDVAASVEGREVRLSRGGGPVATIEAPEGASVAVVDDEWHPGFNITLPARTVVVTAGIVPPAELVTSFRWRDH